MCIPTNCGVRTISTKPTADPAHQAPEADSRQQPAWHVVVLGILTFLLYIVYWAYKTWRDLKDEAQRKLVTTGGAGAAPSSAEKPLESGDPLSLFANINPGLRTLGLLSPLLDFVLAPAASIDPFFRAIAMFYPILAMVLLIYLLSVLVIGVSSLVPDATSFPRKHPLICCGAVVGGHLLLLSFVRLPEPFSLLALLSVVPFAFVQHWLNLYWKSVEPADMPVRYAFNGIEMAIIVVGAGLLGLVSTGAMLGIKPH